MSIDLDGPTALLGGLSPAQFMRRHWQREPLLVRAAWPGVVAPASRRELFALAARDEVESRLVTHEGETWTLRRGPIPRRAPPALAAPRWTLLVQGLDLHCDAAHEMLARFRFVPDARLDDLMVSYAADGGGVGAHIDFYDVFLLQVQGRRRWRWGRVERPRWRDDVPLKMLADFTPEHDHLLEPGDMLYLPPGWAHDGVAVGGDCMTASIGFRAPREDELARALLAQLADADGADGLGEPGAALYRDAQQRATATPGELPAALARFAQRAVQRRLARPGAVARALGEWITEPKAEVWFERACGGSVVQGVRLDRKTRMGYDARHVFINGESIRASGRDARLMHRLADARALDARALRAVSADALALLEQWRDDGWLHATTPDEELR